MMATMAMAGERPPKIFIINGHGSSVIDEKTQTPVVIDSLVDTFTTAKIGFPLITYPMNIGKTTTFNDDAYTWFKYQLHKNLSSRDVETKDQYRDVILRSLCETRDTGRDPRRPHVLDWRCKFRCHKLHKKITDMYLFLDGSPVNERILEFDMVTGDMDDVEHMFGLQEKSADKMETTPSGPPREKTPEIMEGLRQYEASIAYLEDLLKTAPRSNIRNLKKEIKTKRKELEMHHLRLSKLNKRSNFEYNESLQKEYGSEPIKLSVILRTAIKNGTIDPKNDFVVVFACRVPSMEVEELMDSPRDLDEARSVGGFSRSKKRKPRKQGKRNQSKRKQIKKSH